MSQNTRELLDALWEYLGFLANGLLFLLVGLSIEVPRLLDGLWAVGLAVLAVTLARLLVVELSTRLVPAERSLATIAGRLVLAWGGLRGALTLALAHALPENFPARDVIVTMSIGVVLFTLLAQGATLPLVIRLTGLTRREAA
jgi:CPA1 family monovalent cation:H+ antiporter